MTPESLTRVTCTEDRLMREAAFKVCTELRLRGDVRIVFVINGIRTQRSLIDVLAAGVRAEAARLGESQGLR